jgi:hypothetical protein
MLYSERCAAMVATVSAARNIFGACLAMKPASAPSISVNATDFSPLEPDCAATGTHPAFPSRAEGAGMSGMHP